MREGEGEASRDLGDLCWVDEGDDMVCRGCQWES